MCAILIFTSNPDKQGCIQLFEIASVFVKVLEFTLDSIYVVSVSDGNVRATFFAVLALAVLAVLAPAQGGYRFGTLNWKLGQGTRRGCKHSGI